MTTQAWFRRRWSAGWLGPVGVSRLLAFQVIMVAMLVVLVRNAWTAVLGVAVGAVAIAVTFGRWRGRWLTETAALWLRFRRRSGRGPAVAAATPGRTDPRLVALGALAPDLLVEEVGAEGSRLGMASDGAGWYAVLQVDPAEGDVHPPVPLSALARIAAEAGQAGVVMQVVSHSMPAMAGPPGSAGATSGVGAAAKRHFLWVAVRLDARAVADSVVDEPDRSVDVPAVLAELTRRVGRALKRRGLAARVLDAGGITEALAMSCDLLPADRGPVPVREAWDAWYSPRLTHRCFWLQSWPDPDRGISMLAGLNDAPDSWVSIALVLEPRPEDGHADLRCLIRVATVHGRSGPAHEHAVRVVEGHGGRLFPLHGEHGLAVYDTAPSGGGAR